MSEEQVDISGLALEEMEIHSISAGRRKTYDIEIEDFHHYILSNGIISHNSSIICDNVSNGVEPVYMLEYERKKTVAKWPDGMTVDNVKDILKYHKAKDYEYWQGSYNGSKYYYEPHNRGLCEVIKVRDYGYQWLMDNFPHENHKAYTITTPDLKADDHINVQAAVQYYCNQSVSKTVNLPKTYPFSEFKDLYLKAWKRGLNGLTTYREGSMESVFSAIQTERENKGIIYRDIKLPDTLLNGPERVIKREGIKFYIHFSYLPEDTSMKFPVVMWIYTNDKSKGASSVSNRASRALAKLALNKGIDTKYIQETLEKAKEDYPHNRLGRMVSLNLRHNVPTVEILTALMGIEGDNVSTLLTAVRKFLGESIESGTKIPGIKCEKCRGENVVLESGCKLCKDCGHTACG